MNVDLCKKNQHILWIFTVDKMNMDGYILCRLTFVNDIKLQFLKCVAVLLIILVGQI